MNSQKSLSLKLPFLKLFFILWILVLLPSITFAQWNTGGEIENTRINFGFILGLNANTFTIIKKNNWPNYTIQSAGQQGTVTSGKLKYINTNFNSGFHLGLLASYQITDNLDLRFTPDVSFSDRTIAYDYDSLVSNTNLVISNPIIKTVQAPI